MLTEKALRLAFYALLAALFGWACSCGGPASTDGGEAVDRQAAASESGEGDDPASEGEGAMASGLVGRQAPDFTLPSLEGGKVSLSDHLGQDVVILDFWATWCAPCRQIMPYVDKVAEEHADQGVVLYSVNWGQSAEEVRYYLEDTGLQVPVLLDRDNKVGEKYQVRGLPLTVVIGRDGGIKAELSGMSAVRRNLEGEVKKAL